jgi:hypothetical protein
MVEPASFADSSLDSLEGYQRLHGRPPPPTTTRLPSPVASTTTLDSVSTASSLTSPLVLATAFRRIPRLL